MLIRPKINLEMLRDNKGEKRMYIDKAMRKLIKNYDPKFLDINPDFYEDQIKKDRCFLDTNADINVFPHYTVFYDKKFDGKRKSMVVFGGEIDGLYYDYDDRLREWDRDKYSQAIKEAKKRYPRKANQYYGHTQQLWEYFLKVYRDRELDNVSLRFIESGVRPDGHPWAVFGYKNIDNKKLNHIKNSLVKKGLEGVEQFTTTELDILNEISQAGVNISEVTPSNKGNKLEELYFEKRLRDRIGEITHNFKTGLEPSIVLENGVNYDDIPVQYIIYIQYKSKCFKEVVELGIDPSELKDKSFFEMLDIYKAMTEKENSE